MAVDWPLVGRDDELGLLRDVVCHHGGSVVVVGPMGVGKSYLVEHFVASIGDGLRPVMARATRSTATIPFGPFVEWAPAAGRVAAGDRLGALGLISRRLLGSTGRLVLVVDDAHLLDEGSAALVLHLAARSSASVVATVRAGERCPDGVVALWKERIAERVDLQPLPEPETIDLAEAALGAPLDGDGRRRLWELSAGTPLYVRELVRAGVSRGVLTEMGGAWHWRGELAGSGRLGELLGDQLGGATAGQRRMLELLAFGEPLPVGLLRSAGSLAALAEAERDGFVVTDVASGELMVRLAHPIYGELMRAATPRLAVRQHHRDLAVAALAVGWEGRDPLRVASWLLEDPSGAASPGLFLTAADRALSLAEWGLAERLARAAEDAGAGVAATMARADALVPQKRWDALAGLFADLAARDLTDAEQVEVAVARARYLHWSQGRAQDALDVVTEAAGRVRSPHRAELLAHGAYVAVFACRFEEASTLATEAASEAGSVTAVRVEALAVAALAWTMQGRVMPAIAAAEMAIPFAPAVVGRAPNPVAVLPAAYAYALALDGRVGEAAAVAAAVDDMAGAQEVKIIRGVARALVGRLALLQGDLGLAQRAGEEGFSILRDTQLPAHWPAAILATSAAQLGDVRTAERTMEWVATARPAATLYELELGVARAWTTAAQGALSAARSVMTDVAARARDLGAGAMELLALHDLARLGTPEAAAGRLDALTRSVEGRFATAVAGHVLAMVADDGDALDEASRRFEVIGSLLAAAEAAATAAAAHRRAGRRGSRLGSLARARALSARCGDPRTPALAVIDAEPLLASLTRREREVVELAARGLTNREIARRLFLSVRTVHTHLNHAYTKLAVSDRSQLATILRIDPGAGRPGPPTPVSPR